jgi:hypothetical protein
LEQDPECFQYQVRVPNETRAVHLKDEQPYVWEKASKFGCATVAFPTDPDPFYAFHEKKGLGTGRCAGIYRQNCGVFNNALEYAKFI